MKKQYLLFLLTIIIGCNNPGLKIVENKNITTCLGDYEMMMTGNTGKICNNAVQIYNFSKKNKIVVSGMISRNEPVKITEADIKTIYSNGKKIFYLYNIVNDKNGIKGWVTNDNILWPVMEYNNKLIGIKRDFINFDVTGEKVYCEVLKYGEVDYPIFKIFKENNYIRSESFLSEGIEIKDLNGDKIDEIILKGYFVEGIWHSDAFSYQAELWLNFKDNKFSEIYLKLIRGNFGIVSQSSYDSKLIDENKDGFYEKIRLISKDIIDKSVVNPDIGDNAPDRYETSIIEKTFTWNGVKYE